MEIMKTEPDMNKITYEEEKTALILGITFIVTVWRIFKYLSPSRFRHKICVYQNSSTCYKCPQILR